MIRYVTHREFDRYPRLVSGMFRDRTAQFRDRMKWDVEVDDFGWETDQYDILDPIYVIIEDDNGDHAASMRFLPTTGRTMIKEIFSHLVGNRNISSPFTWECTRFCLSPSASLSGASTTIQSLLLGGIQLGLHMGLTHSIGVFDRPMLRVYRRLGWEPEIIGSENEISAGIWTLSEKAAENICAKANVDRAIVRKWAEEIPDSVFGMIRVDA